MSMQAEADRPVIIEVENLKRHYTRGKQTVEALRGVSFKIQKGEFVSIMGPSGSGKSTLLHLLGGLDRPSSGRVKIGGRFIDELGDKQLSEFRRRSLGFVFQFFNLLPTLTALENVALPALLDGKSLKQTEPRALELLEFIGLKNRADHKPDQLSGGEMQRVAIARALATNPLLVLSDEPTGNLDSKTGASVLELFARLVKEFGQTIVMVTHDPRAASFGTRLIQMKDGAIVRDGLPSEVLAAEKLAPSKNSTSLPDPLNA